MTSVETINSCKLGQLIGTKMTVYLNKSVANIAKTAQIKDKNDPTWHDFYLSDQRDGLEISCSHYNRVLVSNTSN